MIKKSITLDYNFGDQVFLKTDNENKRIVTGVILRPSGKMYELANGIETSWHQSVEIEKYPDTPKVRGFRKNEVKI